MPTFSSFGEFAAHLEKMGRSLESGEGARRITKAMGDEAQKIARSEISADVGGDMKFTHWAPTLDTRVRQMAPGRAMLMPTRSGAGPITVANQGRNQGGASGFHGPGVNRKTGTTTRTKSGGLRKVGAVKGSRWNGRTKGKHTADRAVARMAQEIPRVVDRETRKVIAGFFDLS